MDWSLLGSSIGNPFAGLLSVFQYIPSEVYLILVPALVFVFLSLIWQDYIQTKFSNSVKYVMLAINAPKIGEKEDISPVLFEQLFTALHGIQSNPNAVDRFWEGKFQLSYSFEIVGIGNHVRFVIRTPEIFKDFVESQVYAYFPEAEIAEVKDYTDLFPSHLPTKEYDIFGLELMFVKDEHFSLKTYPMFEHSMTKTIIDPVSTLAEVIQNLKDGEFIFIQYLLTPTDDKWKDKGIKFIEKLAGIKQKPKESRLQKSMNAITSTTTGLASELASIVIPGSGAPAAPKKKEEKAQTIQASLIPHYASQMEGALDKVHHVGYRVKPRIVYIAEKSKFFKPRINAIMGSMKLFASPWNALRPNPRTITKVDYFLVKTRIRARQKKLWNAFRYRSQSYGRDPQIWSAREIATAYHFPSQQVGAPSVSSVQTKKQKPPVNLPIVGGV